MKKRAGVILCIIMLIVSATMLLLACTEPVHTHNYIGKWHSDADKHQRECLTCGELSEEEPHDWDRGIAEVKPSCTQKGSMRYMCTKCGFKRWEEVPALSHDYSGSWVCDESGHQRECLDCGSLSEKETHSFEGSTCEICGFTYTDSEKGTEGLSFELDESGNYVVSGYFGLDVNVVIPARHEGKPVTQIMGRVFEGNFRIKSVEIGPNITSVDYCAFRDCIALQSVIIGDGVTVIDSSAFSDCYALSEVTIGKNVTRIGGNAFYKCGQLTSIIVPDSVLSLGSGTFGDCVSLESVELGSGLVEMGGYVFKNCVRLESIELPDGLIAIEDSAFRQCERLRTISLPSSVSLIGDWAFYGCRKLTEIRASGVQSLGYCAFGECGSLKTIELGTKLDIIGDWAFMNCRQLESIELPVSLVLIGNGAFSGCLALRLVFYHGSVEDWQHVIQYNSNLDPHDLYFYARSAPEGGPLNYWHFDEHGEIQVW